MAPTTAPPTPFDLLIHWLRAVGTTPVPDGADLSERGWHRVADAAVQHGVAPLLHHCLQSLPDVQPPEGVRARLRDLYLHNHLIGITLAEQLGDLLTLFRDHDVSAMPLKGADLANRYYEEPALRPMIDLDFLLPGSDLPRAQAALREAGYVDSTSHDHVDFSSLHHVKPVVKRGSAVPVEVHHELVQPGHPFALDLDAIWSRARPVELAGVSAVVMAPLDLVLHLCTHAAYNHRFEIPLLALCDLDVVLRNGQAGIVWERLVEIANADRRARVVYSMLRLVQRVLGTPVPAAVALLDHDRADDDVVDDAAGYVASAHVDVPATLSELGDSSSIAEGTWRVTRSLFPSPRRMREIYGLGRGSNAVYLYYLVRPFDLGIRRARQLVSLLARTPKGRALSARLRRQRAIKRWIEGVR